MRWLKRVGNQQIARFKEVLNALATLLKAHVAPEDCSSGRGRDTHPLPPTLQLTTVPPWGWGCLPQRGALWAHRLQRSRRKSLPFLLEQS